MNIILLISFILPILSIDNNYQTIQNTINLSEQNNEKELFYGEQKSKKYIISHNINFNVLALKDIDCLNYYETNVVTRYKSLSDVPFYEYLEYWWNSEETDDELLERVCNFIYEKYPKRNIRRRTTIN
jgi:hypothetical protein